MMGAAGEEAAMVPSPPPPLQPPSHLCPVLHQREEPKDFTNLPWGQPAHNCPLERNSDSINPHPPSPRPAGT